MCGSNCSATTPSPQVTPRAITLPGSLHNHFFYFFQHTYFSKFLLRVSFGTSFERLKLQGPPIGTRAHGLTTLLGVGSRPLLSTRNEKRKNTGSRLTHKNGVNELWLTAQLKKRASARAHSKYLCQKKNILQKKKFRNLIYVRAFCWTVHYYG